MIGRLILATILTGLITGFFITFYELLIVFMTYFIFMGDPLKTIPSLPIWYLYLVPTIAIFFVNYLASKDNNIREYGVNEIAESVSENRMILKTKTLFLKVIASALSLSTGFSVGTEGPSASIGAMIAYQIHKLFQLPKMLVKVMISVGASAGVAAIFVSPLTGIAFAFENIAHQFIKQYISYLILASVISFAITANYLEAITFSNPAGRIMNNEYILANLFFIPYITTFIFFYLFLKKKVLHLMDMRILKKFHQYRNHFFALLGGGVVGTILLLEPQAAFSGREIVVMLMNDENHIPLLLIFGIIFLRIIGTTVAIYANAVGGIFLPLMSLGALIGYGFGELMTLYLFPVEASYFAAIGASIFMGVIMKLPLTAVILSLEMTFDYNVVIASGIGLVLIEYFSNQYFSIKKKSVNKAE